MSLCSLLWSWSRPHHKLGVKTGPDISNNDWILCFTSLRPCNKVWKLGFVSERLMVTGGSS